VYDYVDGKVDWMAYGLPVEGDDGPFLGGQLEAVATCDVTLTVADARRAIDRSVGDQVVLVHHDGMAVGEVDDELLQGHPDDAPLLDLLRPVPSTVRPSVTVASVVETGGGEQLVTTSDGRLLGLSTVHTDHEHGHEGHDHADHDHGESSVDGERYEAELAEVMTAIEERFGEREPSAEELRAFLRDRLVAEGRSAEEAERYLDELEVAEGED